MATNSISARGRKLWQSWYGISWDRVTALSDWLQAHAAAAALDSLAVQGDGDSFSKGFPILQLPVQQLASLRSLDLQHVTVTVQLQAGADTQTTPPNLPPELLGITSLRLWSAGVGLSTLSAFTNLQHLALTVDGDSSVELSSLPHLTHLHLGCAQDAVMASVSSLTSLQELEVEGDCTADGLAALPASLTKLCVRGKVTLAPDSTPAVAQLTALQWLEVDRADGFSTAVLRSMSSLQHLAVRHTPLLSAQGVVDDDVWGVDLAPFSVLTQLQHLELPVGTTTEYAAADAETDVAASQPPASSPTSTSWGWSSSSIIARCFQRGGSCLS
jgi:hypothetical protein